MIYSYIFVHYYVGRVNLFLRDKKIECDDNFLRYLLKIDCIGERLIYLGALSSFIVVEGSHSMLEYFILIENILKMVILL